MKSQRLLLQAASNWVTKLRQVGKRQRLHFQNWSSLSAAKSKVYIVSNDDF